MTPEDVTRWGTFAHGSPLYAHLADVIAADPELMRIINRVEHTPRPNVLLGAVQYLLARDESTALSRFYPNLDPDPVPIEGVAAPFREFVVSHEEQIVHIGHTRFTQTNECRRCAVLLPVIWMSGLDRFHLVDIGTSAGLNLGIDRYRYRWGDMEWGPEGGLLLDSEPKGVDPVPAPIDVLSRTGLDLHPVDPGDPDQRLWLESLIWPEHVGRRERLRAALDLVGTIAIRFVTGDAAQTLPDVLAGLPDAEPAVVINSFAMNQFPQATRSQIEETVELARSRRPIVRVSFEIYASQNVWGRLQMDAGGGWVDVGQAQPHGEWFELYALP